jgi:flagellar motility protein MotE (MotC chaperone)
MSISNITQAPGFNQQLYDSLIQQARTEKVDTGLVDSLLLKAINKGKSFDQALAMVGSELPKLATPTGSSFALLKDWPGLPSPGALIMSVTTEYAAEQRRQNQELMWKETEAITQSMKDQAAEMRKAAVTQLVLGCVSGAVQIGVGVAQIGMGAHAVRQGSQAASKAAKEAGEEFAAKAATDAFNNALTKANINITAVGQMGSGAAAMIKAGGEYVAVQMQARAKELEADQEKMRAVRESIKNLDETLREVIRKSLAAQNDIQASTNQARTRILA